MKVVTREVVEWMGKIVRKMGVEDYTNICVEVRCWHPGEALFLSDASDSYENQLIGWGLREMGKLWPLPGQRRRDRPSILERCQ